MEMTVFAGLMAGLLLVIALAEPLAARLRIPFALVLTGTGSVIGLAIIAFADGKFGFNPGWKLERALKMNFSSGIFLEILLPILIFQVAISLNAKRMFEDWLPILVMAVPAVMLATFCVGLALNGIGNMNFFAALLIGAIVSTTDPGAIIDIFKSLSAPPRLVRLIQGESLLNDATAIALFSFFLALVALPGAKADNLKLLLDVPLSMAGGLVLGWLVIRLIMPVLTLMTDWPTAQITLTLLLPFAAFQIAEFLDCSGVVAVFAAGLGFNLAAHARLTPSGWSTIHNAWKLIAHWGRWFDFSHGGADDSAITGRYYIPGCRACDYCCIDGIGLPCGHSLVGYSDIIDIETIPDPG